MILKKLVSLILLVNILACSVFVTPVFAQDTPTLFFEFNEDSENITYAPHENEIVASDAQLYFNRSNNTNDCFVDITMGDYFKDVNEFIIDFVFVPVKIGTSLRLFRAINESTACNFIALTKNSNLQICGSAYKDEDGNYLKISEETRICLHVNIKDKLCDVYVGSQLIEDVSFDGIYDPVGIKRFRLGTDSQDDATKFYANDIKIYSGSAPYDGDEFKRVRYTVMDKVDGVEKAQAILGQSIVFSEKSFYADGKKQNCNILSAKPYFEGETLMVPSDAAGYLGYNCNLSDDVITFNGVTIAVGNKTAVTQDNQTVVLDAAPVFKEGILFVPFKSFCELAELYTYCDNRGFTVASSGEINLSNSDDGNTITEDSDTVYRYMNFDRPSGSDIVDIIKASDNKKPRLLATPERIEKVKQNITSDSEAEKLYDYTIAKANSILELDCVEYEISDGIRLFDSCNNVKNRIQTLAAAYMLTDNKDYADKIWSEMENALSWDDWNTKRHFLDTGEIAPGIAVGYDVLRNGYLTDAQKTWIQQRLKTLCLDFTMDAYVGYYTGSEFRYTSVNWGAVCAGGILSLCMSLAPDAEGEFREDLEYLIENTMHSLEFALEVLFPDGATGDGPVYWGFRAEYLTSWCIGALLNYCGDDYGFLSANGWQDTFMFSLTQSGPGGAFNFGNCLERTGVNYLPQGYQAALIEQDTLDMTMQHLSRKISGDGEHSLNCIWYEPELVLDEEVSLPTDNFFGGQEISIMRESWYSENSAYVGVRGGLNTIGSHHDKGTFIFDSQGVRWAVDLGKDDYNITGGYYGEDGHTLYRKRTEGQNCVVINPNSESTGQVYDNVSAQIEKCDSSEKSAYCIYDLSEVYSDNVSKYKRGFYLGDNRQSLTVRDEISLLDQSDLYWFMHTRAEIEISEDGHEAILTKDGKKLKATAICNTEDWHFEVREAQPFDQTMIRDGEYSRDEFQKLTLVTSGNENVNITVKLSPVENDITPVADTALSDWELESGSLEKKAKFLSSQIVKPDAAGKADIKLRIPYKPQKMQVLLNGEEILEQTDFGFTEEHYITIDTKNIDFSNFVLKVICTYDGYTTQTEQDFILLDSMSDTNNFSCDFSGITDENTAFDLKNSGFTNIALKNGHVSMYEDSGALGITVNDTRTIDCGYIEKSYLGIPSDGIIRLSFDMNADYGAAIYFSFTGIDVSPASSRIDLPDEISGRVELILDGESYKLFVKDADDNYIYSDDGVYNLSGLKNFRLTFYSMVAGAKIKLDNLSLEHFSYPKTVVTEISRYNENIVLSMQRGNENIYTASYGEDELLSAKFLAENESTLTLDENAFNKVFVWDTQMNPLMKAFKFQKGND